jgi:PhnB protein
VSRVCTYLNFPGQSEEALTHYRDLFGTQFVGPIFRFGDTANPGGPDLSPEDANKIMHMEVEIAGGHVVMATDMLESMGQQCRVGNNTTIMIECNDRAAVDRLYAGLAGGIEESAPAEQPWGQYWSCCLDRFGIRWMITTPLSD